MLEQDDNTTCDSNNYSKKEGDKGPVIPPQQVQIPAAAVSEDKIDNKDLLPSLTETNITKLCFIMCKVGGKENGHKVLMIDEDHLKLAVYWVQHQIRISQPWDLTAIGATILGSMI